MRPLPGLSRITQRREVAVGFLADYGIYVALAILIAIYAVLSPPFFKADNGLSIVQQTSTIGIVAAGEALVIMAGGIDISVGSTLGLGGMVAAMYWRDHGGDSAVVMATLLGVAAGMLVGLFNGIVVTQLRISPVITTLATLSGVRGLVYIISNQTEVNFPERSSFYFLGRGHIGPLPVVVVAFLAIVVAAWVLEHHTTIGRSIHALGGNQHAARLSGVRMQSISVTTYAISGGCAALAGIFITSQIGLATTYQGTGYELNAIAATVVGGISLTGGLGNVLLAVFGALFIGVFGNGMALLNVPDIWQMVLKGVAIIAAATLYQVARRQRS